MTKEITQEERLDLTDEKIRAEKLAFSIELFKSLEAITRGKKVVKDCILKADCDLMAENERLKKQLKDYEKTLKEYADRHNWSDCWGECDGLVWETGDNKGWETAQEILKKWEDK